MSHGVARPGRLEMKKFKLVVAMMALAVLIPGQLWSGGPRMGGRAIGGANAGGVPPRATINGVFVAPGYAYYPYYYGPAYPQIWSPYSYPYYLPPTVVANLPFFCALHQVGFWNRAGMLDHLAGTHKFPLEAAAYICPDGAESCLFPAY